MSTTTNKVQTKIAIIGAGFAGISAAAYLSKQGYQVDVYEKNADIGGRARQLITENGYLFDMGPSWYWMPEVFEKFFNDFGYKAADFYELQLLDPGFSVVFGSDDVLNIPANFEELCQLFESIETGSAKKLKAFLAEAAYKYNIGMGKLVYKPGLSLMEFADADLIKGLFKLQVFTSFSEHVKKYFKDPRLIALMEFPVLFLGAMPEDTPALYSLMNYAGLKLGTWYPKGGFGKVIKAMKTIAEMQGAKFHTNAAVTKIEVKENQVVGLASDKGTHHYDGLIAAADYHHVEEKLLNTTQRNYSEKYWDNRVLAPSCLIFYLGVNTRVARLNHHTLFFDEDLKQHSQEIYKQAQWPTKPLFYVCCPSVTDPSVAPAGHENLFVLMPLATDIKDPEAIREQYFDLIMDRLEAYTGTPIRKHLDYKKSYCVSDFITDYNSFKGNAYGLANTLMQTANLKPTLKNKKINNLFYAGQLTVPGPGVPPSIISGNLAAQQLIKHLNK
ncbi:phytoene desaturase family protein [Pedobacter gandavensis]|uniref:phytoene desaturase family protein n=1 Tax=Pedobacter gandavensis TaxID=2679963 RepID=UPI00247AE990|nr:phytoene desaturase family protein [Pedobacter gandavensis]WGQ10866.1 phytoene desaturase family protein [Pedobacter gandavensis]